MLYQVEYRPQTMKMLPLQTKSDYQGFRDQLLGHRSALLRQNGRLRLKCPMQTAGHFVIYLVGRKDQTPLRWNSGSLV